MAANRRLLVAAALWAAVAVSGQELSRTQIADTLFNADGSRAVGSLRISWKSFTGADGSTVAKNSVDLDIVDGIVSVALAPNLGAVPDGTYYSIEYRLHKGERSNELWIVPDSEDPVSIADIRVLSVPAAGISVSLSQVNGLPAVLDSKADKAAANTFMAPQILREDSPGTSNPLLGLQKNDGAAGVYFRVPELSGDVTYTLPPNAGSPNQALTTDGSGALFWSSAAGGGAGSGSAYEVLQQGGTSVAQRTVANFTSGFLVSDNSGQLRTDITPNFGTAAGTIAQGNDSRLSDARTPLTHASTHAASGSDPLTPASIGALNRTNDFMVGTSPTTPVLKLQGSTGQAAALQEWRDGSGALAALITAEGNGFFREIGVSAPTGGTTVSQFFEIGGLKKFALSATDGVFDVLRYDNTGLFLDRPLRVFRSGKIETTVSMKVTDAGIGSGALGFTGDYIELQGVAAPSIPASGFGRLFLNSANGEVSVKKTSGTVLSLEQGGGDVAGPASATDNSVPRFDGTSGKTLQGSGLIVDDADNLTVPGAVSIGSGAAPFNLTGYTDDAAPSAPGTANQFSAYVDRSNGLWSWIVNGGTAQSALTAGQINTFAELDAIVEDKALVNTTDVQTLTGKTYDAEADGNSITLPSYVDIPVTVCTNGTTGAATVSLPTANAPAAACVSTATNANLNGTLAFDAATDESFQHSLRLPHGWTGNVDLEVWWQTAATTGSVVWATQTACMAPGEDEDGAFNAADAFSADAADPQALNWNVATDLNIAMTGCDQDEYVILKFFRDANNGADTLAADALVREIRLTLRTTY